MNLRSLRRHLPGTNIGSFAQIRFRNTMIALQRCKVLPVGCTAKHMNTDDLEARLQGGVETQSLDVKVSCAWNAETMAKDVLAMSNVQDGGCIVIGVTDAFERQGIEAGHKATYNIDIMKDQMAGYAEPHVDFNVTFPVDRAGREYVAIEVFPFVEQPVICRRDGREVRAGVVYYRNRSGRPQSAAVSNALDMREIVTTAAVRMMQWLSRRGLTSVQPDSERQLRENLAAEREGL